MIELRDTYARWAASSAFRASPTALGLFAGGCEDGCILDRETTSTRPFTGEAVAEALPGEQRDYVSSGTGECCIWAAQHPGTEIFGPETVHGSRS